jgi:hypothetical protein
MKPTHLTVDHLKKYFSYDPLEGVLRWKISPRHSVPAGQIAGTISGGEGNKYLYVSIQTRLYKAHAIIFCMMTGQWPHEVVDHIDGDTLNNKWSNLRACSQRENCCNQRIRENNRSGRKGAHLNKHGTWTAQICVNYKKIYLGSYKNIDEAHAAYTAAALKYHGEFARLR